ncbi:MAG TPA: UpxY family transcription antiterminator [Candidatus Acidoferrales bacterium]
MSGLQELSKAGATSAEPRFEALESSWYAIHTVARHEKRVEQQLRENGVLTFLPLTQQIRQWSDRRMTVQIPLFSCYAFVRTAQTPAERLKVLRTPGVLGFVGSERVGTPIPRAEIEALQTAIREKVPFGAHPFIEAGKRVRIRGGVLNGMEGILTEQRDSKRLVISVELLKRSVCIQVEGYSLELV